MWIAALNWMTTSLALPIRASIIRGRKWGCKEDKGERGGDRREAGCKFTASLYAREPRNIVR